MHAIYIVPPVFLAIAFVFSMLGMGGSQIYIPIMFWFGLEPKDAAATSALAVTFSGVSSFVSHLATAAHPDWGLWAACVAAVFMGSQLGSRFMAAKLKGKGVRRVFACALLMVAAILIVKEVL